MAGLKVARSAGQWRQMAAEIKARANVVEKRALFLEGELLRIQEERTGLQDRIQLLEVQNRDLMGVIAVAHQREMLWESATHLIVEARVGHWEDSAFDEVYDHEDGLLVPLRRGNMWCPIIELRTGRVLNWHKGLTAKIHYKVCDQGRFCLGGATGNEVLVWTGERVPRMVCIGEEGWGEYIIMRIGPDGYIKGWQRPFLDLAEWAAVASSTVKAPPSIEFRQWSRGFENIPRRTYRTHAEKHPVCEGYGRWDGRWDGRWIVQKGECPVSLQDPVVMRVDLSCDEDISCIGGYFPADFFSSGQLLFLRPCLPDGNPCPWPTEDK